MTRGIPILGNPQIRMLDPDCSNFDIRWIDVENQDVWFKLVGKSARTGGARGVIIRWHKSTKVQVYLGGGAFFGKNLLFLIGRDVCLHKTL